MPVRLRREELVAMQVLREKGQSASAIARQLHVTEGTVRSRVRSLVAFYVSEHNSRIPHSAFQGQTPDEMYFGTGAAVPEKLAEAKAAARAARLAENPARRCGVCA